MVNFFFTNFQSRPIFDIFHICRYIAPRQDSRVPSCIHVFRRHYMHVCIHKKFPLATLATCIHVVICIHVYDVYMYMYTCIHVYVYMYTSYMSSFCRCRSLATLARDVYTCRHMYTYVYMSTCLHVYTSYMSTCLHRTCRHVDTYTRKTQKAHKETPSGQPRPSANTPRDSDHVSVKEYPTRDVGAPTERRSRGLRQ